MCQPRGPGVEEAYGEVVLNQERASYIRCSLILIPSIV